MLRPMGVKGLTLIEVLLVLALLGVAATALLVFIIPNPFLAQERRPD